MTNPDLATSLDDLAAAARAAGVNDAAARIEGEQLAAAVSESAVGSFVDWCVATGQASARVSSWRLRCADADPGRPPPHWSRNCTTSARHTRALCQGALAEVATAAALLGADPESTGAAQGAASVQLSAAQGLTAGGPGLTGPRGDDTEFVRQAPQILSSVLGRMHDNQARMLDLRQLDPFGPGAIADANAAPPAAGEPVGNRLTAGEPQPPVQAAPPAEPAEPPKCPNPKSRRRASTSCWPNSTAWSAWAG